MDQNQTGAAPQLELYIMYVVYSLKAMTTLKDGPGKYETGCSRFLPCCLKGQGDSGRIHPLLGEDLQESLYGRDAMATQTRDALVYGQL